MPKQIKRMILWQALLFISFAFFPVYAQDCPPGTIACETDEDCALVNCPDCVRCIDNLCQPDDSICQDNVGNDCRVGICEPQLLTEDPEGCVYLAPPLDGEEGFPLECYYCSPPALEVNVCGNGVCDSPNEDCSNCPEDCRVEGFVGETCPVDTDGMNCNPLDISSCEDGDACTINLCENPIPDDMMAQPVEGGICSSEPAGCSQDADDQCCPAGCFGPPNDFRDNAFPCREAFGDDPEQFALCDVNCWPTQACGDGFVQDPETCDDSVPGPNSGLLPNGTEIPDESCRDSGSENECTFCGDGIVQAPSEECDGAQAEACGGLGCDANCQCNIPDEDICLTGSGEIVNSELKVDCSTCSLNKHYQSNNSAQYFLLLFLASIVVMRIFLLRMCYQWKKRDK